MRTARSTAPPVPSMHKEHVGSGMRASGRCGTGIRRLNTSDKRGALSTGKQGERQSSVFPSPQSLVHPGSAG